MLSEKRVAELRAIIDGGAGVILIDGEAIEALLADRAALAAEVERLKAEQQLFGAWLDGVGAVIHDHFEAVGRPLPTWTAWTPTTFALREELARLRAAVAAPAPAFGEAIGQVEGMIEEDRLHGSVSAWWLRTWARNARAALAAAEPRPGTTAEGTAR